MYLQVRGCIPSIEVGISKVAYRLAACVSEGTHPANGKLDSIQKKKYFVDTDGL